MSAPAEKDLPAWCVRLVSELEDADRRARSVAGELTPEQLNWRAAPGTWSVGQCLEHLLHANEVYLPAISAALTGQPPSAVGEIRFGWFSRWFIRNYIAPNPQGNRARAPQKIAPAVEVQADILARFLRSNQAARDLVRRAADYDVNAIRFRNPFVPLLRFTVGTGLEITAKHESRHLLQAEKVRRTAGFPVNGAPAG